MAPPTAGLPESSLIIAPNQKHAANKKRRRPAFRPGQQRTTAAKKKAAVAEKNKTGTKPTKETASGQETPPPAESIEQTTDPSSTAPTATENAASPAASAPATSQEVPKESDAPTEAREAPNTKPSIPKPKALSMVSASKKMPVSILHGKKNSHNPTKSISINKKPAAVAPKAKAIAPLKPGRKRKSTGLVVGASRIKHSNTNDPPRPTRPIVQTRAQRQTAAATQDVDGSDDDMPPLQNAKAVSTTTTIEAMTASASVPPAPQAEEDEEQYVPPPKEGEVKLGQFCSKFRVKGARGGGKNQTKKKKDQDAKEKNNQVASEESKEEEPPSAGPVVQIIDGEIVLQESSMVVERGGASGLVSSNRNRVYEEDEYAVVEEDNEMAVVGASYNSFVSRKSKPQHWTLEETKLFYEALRQVGTDFMLMSEFYPNENRKQLKKKYQREYTKNAKLVELALHPSQQKPLDLTIFQVDQKEVTEQVKVQKQKDVEEEAKAKEAAEKKKQEEIDNPGGATGNNEDKENELEVVEEDGEEEPQGEATKPSDATNDNDNTPTETAAEEEEKEEEEKAEPLWPDAPTNENVFEGEEGEFDEDVVVEEDPLMLEDFHYSTNEFEADNPARDDDDDDGMGEEGGGIEGNRQEPQGDIDTAAPKAAAADVAEKLPVPKPNAALKTSSPPKIAAEEPALSLVPTAKKKTNTKKPKFRSARPVKKKR